MNETVIETKRIRVIEQSLSDIECYLQDQELNQASKEMLRQSHREYSDALEQARKDAAVLLEHDHMPVQVAREMLLVPAGQGRMTARQRKTTFPKTAGRRANTKWPGSFPKPASNKSANG